MKTILFTRPAQKTFRSLPSSVQAAIVANLERYAATGEGSVKALTGQPGARIRVGHYRAIFIETAETIEVLAADHRSRVYR